MTNSIVSFLISCHLVLLPTFSPKISGIHDAELTVASTPKWHTIFHSETPEIPDGIIVMFIYPFK